MIVTDEQRRWWFATHPEYSWSNRKGRRNAAGHLDDDDSDEPIEVDNDTGKLTPEQVDASMDEMLKYETSPTGIILLKEAKFWFGTEFANKSPEEKAALLADEDEPDDHTRTQQAPQDAQKDTFIRTLMDARWSREQAEHKWKVYQLNQNIAKNVAWASEMQGGIGLAKAIGTGASKALGFAAGVIRRGRPGPRTLQFEITERFLMTPAIRKEIAVIEKELEVAGLNRRDFKLTYFKDKFVARRDGTFSLFQKDSEGLTNLQRMERGWAPYDRDGKKVVLHHTQQRNEGPMIELTSAEHKVIRRRQGPSQINRGDSDEFRGGYWQAKGRYLQKPRYGTFPFL